MRIIKSFSLVILIGIAMLGLSVSSTMAAIVEVPTLVNPGEGYRLAFVSSTTRFGTSSNVADYNSFVDALAPTINGLDLNWFAIVSTATVDARDNTGTNPTVDPTGVPIFLLNDTLLASGNTALWSGTIANPLDVTETGGPLVVTPFAWTGTNSDGTGKAGNTLGFIQPGIGLSTLTNSQWVDQGIAFNFNSLSVYAISEEILAPIPLPAALPLYGTGLVVMGFLGWRRKRQALRN